MNEILKDKLTTLNAGVRQNLPCRLNFCLYRENCALGDLVRRGVRTVKIVHDLRIERL